MGVAIRQLTDTDPVIISQTFAQIGWNKPVEQYQRYLEQQRQGEAVVLVAAWDAAFAGYLKVAWNSDYPHLRDQGNPEIEDLNVLPCYRRRGIATALMDEAETVIAERSPRVGLAVGLHPGYNARNDSISYAAMSRLGAGSQH